MDSVQIPVPPDVIPTQITQTTPVATEQDDLFDKFLKKLVDFIGKLLKKFDTPSTPTVPLWVPPQTIQTTNTQNILGNIWSTIENVANQAVKVANNAVSVAGTGVDSVVKWASEYIAEPVTPAPTVDVQDFLSQNYQSTPVVTTPIEPSPETPPTK